MPLSNRADRCGGLCAVYIESGALADFSDGRYLEEVIVPFGAVVSYLEDGTVSAGKSRFGRSRDLELIGLPGLYREPVSIFTGATAPAICCGTATYCEQCVMTKLA